VSSKLFRVEYFNQTTPDSVMLNAILDYSLRMDGSEFKISEFHGFPYDQIEFYSKLSKPKGEKVSASFPLAYLFAGLSYYYLSNENKELDNYLLSVANDYANDDYTNTRYRINVPDKVPIGLLYINLYRKTGENKYLEVSKAIFKRCLEFRTRDNLIPYDPVDDFYYIDCTGMIIPFLQEYYSVTGDSLARQVALDNLYTYHQYAVDKETGLPCHGFNPDLKLKMGSANWGRGIGWYLLAAAYTPEFRDSVLDRTLENLPKTQFPGINGSRYDSSTDLMIELYKQSKDTLRTYDFFELKLHTRSNGMIDDCSGDTHGWNDYSHLSCGSELCNGLYLIIVSKFANK